MQTIILGQRKYYNMAIKMVLDVFKNQNDTLLLNGEWSCVDTKINLQSEFKELQGSFEVTEFDCDYMKWTKTIGN